MPLPRLRSLIGRLIGGGAGVAAAVLAPRAASLITQWLLAFMAGPGSLTAYAMLTSRGAVAVSLVASGVAPTLLHRSRALRSRPVRALAGGALLILAALAAAASLAYELSLGVGGRGAWVVAAFSACALFASAAPAVWPIWQLEGRYLHVLAALLVFAPAGSGLAALAGRPGVACLATGLASATAALLLLGRTRLRRALRYAVLLVRRAIPLSLVSFATAIVFPTALSYGGKLLGPVVVDGQLLFWSFVAVLSTASQSFASRALAGVPSERRGRAIAVWMRAAAGLGLVAVGLYAALAARAGGAPWGGGAHPMPLTLLVSGVAPLVTDPLCFYFSNPRSRRLLVIGSVASSAVIGAALVLAPGPLVTHFGVIGPSAVIGVLRLGFVQDEHAGRVARVAMVLLLAGYAAALLI